MKYAELEKVNSDIKYMPMGDALYAPVAERILAFRKIYPDGFIVTKVGADHHNNVVVHAKVGMYTEDGGVEHILGTGTAREKSFHPVDNYSPLERAETAAVGRALGMAGFGVNTNVSSFEEISQIPLDAPVENVNLSDRYVSDIPTPEPIDLGADDVVSDVETSSEIPEVVKTPSGSEATAKSPKSYKSDGLPDNDISYATDKQKTIISKYYGNQLTSLLESLGVSSLDELHYDTAAEVISQMVSA